MLNPLEHHLLLTVLPSETLELVVPLPLNVVQGEQGEYIVSEDVLLNYGVGTTPEWALRDFVSATEEYYDLVRDARQEGGPNRLQLGYVQQFLREK